MIRFIVSRLVQLPVILLVIYVVTLTLAWQIPGNPLDNSEGRRANEAITQAQLRQYNLDSGWSFATGYLRGLTRGDMGASLQYRDQTVSGIIASSLPVSAALGALALMFALLIGVGTGIIGALWPRSPLDWGSLAVSLIGVSLPTFVTGVILLVVFVGVLEWAPLGGWEWPWSEVIDPDVAMHTRVFNVLHHMLLPALTLSLGPAAYIARLTRLGLADVLASDFVRTARAKGVSRSKVIYKHALKVAFLPVLSFLGPAAAYTLTGSFVVEQVFNIPGMGEYFVNGVRNKDLYLIVGVVLCFSTILVLFNLLVDVLYAWIDPRIDVAK